MNLAIHRLSHQPHDSSAANDILPVALAPGMACESGAARMNSNLQTPGNRSDATLAEAFVLLAMGALSGALIPLLIIASESATTTV
jgi:hypothetical protein